MDQSHSTINKHRCRHLSFEERVAIQTYLGLGWSPNRIAKELGRAPNTIRNEIRRGMGNSRKKRRGRPNKYKADRGQRRYKENRRRCGRKSEFNRKKRFLAYFVRHFSEEGWSPDACRGKALLDGFSVSETVSTRTLYRYIDAALLGIRNIDLVSKLRRRSKGHGWHRNKRIPGRSIEERPASVQERNEFGHWEADLVIGSKSGNDRVLLTLIERKTRRFFLIPVNDKTAENVKAALVRFMDRFKGHKAEIFKSLTTDNGSEFAKLHELDTDGVSEVDSEDTKRTRVCVYFAHPYTSYEKGSIERHNGLIRRYIRKGQRIDGYSTKWVEYVEMWCNALPRKILGYKTPEELFDAELDLIYAL